MRERAVAADLIPEATWKVFVERLGGRRVTPVVGAGASFDHVGSTRSLAEEWAEEVGYPGADPSNLAAVAQFVATTRDAAEPGEYIAEFLSKQIGNWTAAAVPDPYDPYRALTKLPIPIYVTTNYDDLIVRGLKAHNKLPRVAVVKWTPPDRNWQPSDPPLETDYQPSVEEPLVFHLHGRYEDTPSMVITDADYLDFLTQMATNDLLPPVVTSALANNALLFIGYSFGDPNFQLLLRGWQAPRRGIAVQPALNAADAERYAKYYPQYVRALTGKELDMFWGTASEFCEELCERVDC